MGTSSVERVLAFDPTSIGWLARDRARRVGQTIALLALFICTSVVPAAGVAPSATDARPIVAAPCTVTLAGALSGTNGSGQLITVEASGLGATTATLTAWSRPKGCWTRSLGPWQARVGISGVRADKWEGDGATPAGLFGIQSTMYGNAALSGLHYRYHLLVCGDWWDEDVRSPTYNSFQVVPCDEEHPPFDNGASEALWTETIAYSAFAVIDYNPGRIPGKGSAIFLHADTGSATAGCVSLPSKYLDQLLRWMLPGERPIIAIGTAQSIRSY